MELGADEFVSLVQAGGNVAGARISGGVKLDGTALMRQLDWTGCRFDSSIQLTGARIPDGHLASERGALPITALDLSGVRVAGSVTIDGLAIADGAERRRPGATISLQGAKVDGDVIVLGDDGGVALDVSNAVVFGQVFAKGVINRFDARDATIGARLSLQLDPVDVERSVAVSVSRATIGGDMEVVPHDAGVLRTFEEHADTGVPPQIDIFVIVDADRVKVGGDLLIGIPDSDYAESRNWPALATQGINLRRAEVAGEIVVRQVCALDVEPLEDNAHHYVAMAGRKLRCGAIRVSNLQFNTIIHRDSGIDSGESVQLVELDDASIHGAARIFRVLGTVACLPREWSGPKVHGLSMRRLQCESLQIDTASIVNVDRDQMELLPVDLEGAEIRDVLEFRLRSRLTHEFDPGDPELFQELEQKFTGDITPEVSLVGAKVGRLGLDDPPVKENFNLTGSDIRRWNIGSGGQEEETSKNYLALLEATQGLDMGLYRAIEKRLEDIGKRRDADEIHVAWQRRRRKERIYSQSKPRWVLSLLHDVALAYGTKTWRPAIMLLLTFLVSTGLIYVNHSRWVQVASAQYGVLSACGEPCADRLAALGADRDRWQKLQDALALSTANLTPIVDLGVGSELEPAPASGGGGWLLFLRVLGLVAWPVLLAGSLARIIHKRNLG